MSPFQADLLSTTSNLPDCLWSILPPPLNAPPAEPTRELLVVFGIRRGLPHPLRSHVHSSHLPNKKLVGVRTRSSAKTLFGTVSVHRKSTSKMAKEMSLKKYLRQYFSEEGPYWPQNHCKVLVAWIQIFLPTHKRFFHSKLTSYLQLPPKLALLWNAPHSDKESVWYFQV